MSRFLRATKYLVIALACLRYAHPAAAATEQDFVGSWKVDLRPQPGAEPYFHEMILGQTPEGEWQGTFYGSPIESMQSNSLWGDPQLAFLTRDDAGAYHTTMVLRGDRLEGRTHSLGRDFLSVWTAERVPDSAKGRVIDEIVRSYFEAGEFAGTVLIADAGEVIYAKGFGQADRNGSVPNGPDTKFLIASVTKQFTALLIMQFVEEGKLDLNGTISQYLPYYRKDTGSKIHVRHLLQHTSGLPEGVTELDQYDDAMALVADRREYTKKFWMGDPTFEAGTDFNYANTDYGILGAILEEVSGQTFEQLLESRILGPLGMKNSGMISFGQWVPDLATGYLVAETGIQIRPYLGQPDYAAAGMYSTVRDLFRWNQAIQNHELLSKERTEQMLTPIVDINETSGNYVAFGSWVYDRALSDGDSVRLVERRGYISPYTSLNVIAPKEGHSILLLCNVDPVDIHGLPYAPGLPYDLLLALYDLPAEGPKR